MRNPIINMKLNAHKEFIYVCFLEFFIPQNLKLFSFFASSLNKSQKDYIYDRKLEFNLAIVKFKEFKVFFTVLYFVGNPVFVYLLQVYKTALSKFTLFPESSYTT